MLGAEGAEGGAGAAIVDVDLVGGGGVEEIAVDGKTGKRLRWERI